MTEYLNKLHQVIEESGGFGPFCRLIPSIRTTSLREIVAGERVPTESTRRMIIRASRGRLTMSDIIDISGKETAETRSKFDVDPMWEVDDDTRRRMIAEKASAAARAQRQANRKLLT